MSDTPTPAPTPETDEACRAEHDGKPSHYVIADFARKLERQRDEAMARIVELEIDKVMKEEKA